MCLYSMDSSSHHGMSYAWKTIHVYEVKYRSKALESRLQIVLGRIEQNMMNFISSFIKSAKKHLWNNALISVHKNTLLLTTCKA